MRLEEEAGGEEDEEHDGLGQELAQEMAVRLIETEVDQRPHDIDELYNEGNRHVASNGEQCAFPDTEYDTNNSHDGRYDSCDEELPCIACTCKNTARGAHDELAPYGEGEQLEVGHGRVPLVAVEQGDDVGRGEEAEHHDEDAGQGEELYQYHVFFVDDVLARLVLGEDGLQHGGDHVGQVGRGIGHQAVGLVIVAEARCAEHAPDQQVVEVAFEIIN